MNPEFTILTSRVDFFFKIILALYNKRVVLCHNYIHVYYENILNFLK